jgi:hypothetical protein
MRVRLGLFLGVLLGGGCTGRITAPIPDAASHGEGGASAGRAPTLDAKAPASDLVGGDVVWPRPVGLGDPTLIAPAELARRLARALWQSEPDADLLAAVTASPPRNAGELEDLADGMVLAPRGRARVRRFVLTWLGLDQVPPARTDQPGLANGLWPLLLEETGRFAEHVIFEKDGGVAALVSSRYTLANEPLAKHYGLPGVVGDEFRVVPLDGTVRTGVLTHGAFLVASSAPERTSPSRRARRVLDRLLCQGFLDDPADRDGLEVPPPRPPLRRWIEEATALQNCRPCHRTLDPYGFVLETFDQSGRYRREDGGQIIDTAAMVEGASGPVRDAVELARVLTWSSDLNRCFVRRLLEEFEIGRTPTTFEAEQRGAQALNDPGGNIRRMILRIVSSEAFLTP